MKQLLITLIISVLACQVFAGQKSYDFENIPSDSFHISVLPLGSPFAYIYHGGSGYAFAQKSGFAPFGEFSMAPLSPQNSKPYLINFYENPLNSFSFEVADSNPESNTLMIRAYSETGGKGRLLAEVVETLPAATGFRAKRISIEAPGICSVYFIGDSRLKPNSVFFDNFRVSTEPARATFFGNRFSYADFSVIRENTLYALPAASGSDYRALPVGAGKIITGDYDGDNLSDAAAFNRGTWNIKLSSGENRFVNFGITEDIPLSADFDGDGLTDIAVFREGFWYVLRSSNGEFQAAKFGQAGDVPLAANYDSDGKADFAVFRPSDGTWYILGSRDGFRAQKFGIETDKPVPADYDGDGRADIAVFRDGYWYLLQSMDGFRAEYFGQTGDIPVPNDYAAEFPLNYSNGKDDIAVFRPETGTWFVRTPTGFYARQWGQAGDVPISLAP